MELEQSHLRSKCVDPQGMTCKEVQLESAKNCFSKEIFNKKTKRASAGYPSCEQQAAGCSWGSCLPSLLFLFEGFPLSIHDYIFVEAASWKEVSPT